MAIGRMINKTIALDKELNGVSVEAHLLFVMSLPHLDRDGLISGEPLAHLGTVLPFRPEFFAQYESLIQELLTAGDKGIVIRYETKKGRVLFFPGFRKNQTFIYSREGASVFDPPPGYVRTDTGLELADTKLSQELIATNSRVNQEENTLKLSECKLSECKDEMSDADADATAIYPPGFDEFERMFRLNLITAVKERDPRQSMAGGFSLSDASKAALLQVMTSGPVLSAKAIDFALDQWEEAKPNEHFRVQDKGCVNWLLSVIGNSYKPQARTNGKSSDKRPRVPAPSKEQQRLEDARQAEYEREIAEQLAQAGRMLA